MGFKSNWNSKSKKRKYDNISLIVLAGVVLILILSSALFSRLTVDNLTVTVTDKERIVTGSGDSLSSKFLVYCDSEVLENSDSWWHLKFDSADFQGQLAKDKTYNVKVYGWRVPFLSWYRNIIEINEANK